MLLRAVGKGEMVDSRGSRPTFRCSGPTRLVELLAQTAAPGRRRNFGLIYPVLVSRPGPLTEQLAQAMVYPIMTMVAHPPARSGGLVA